MTTNMTTHEKMVHPLAKIEFLKFKERREKSSLISTK